MSRCHACGLRNSECHVCVRLALAGRRRSEIEKPRGPGTAPDRAKGLEEDGAGHSDGGGERGIFKHNGQGQARCALRARGSGGDGIYRTHTRRAVRDSERTAYLSTWQRLKQASCLTSSCTSHMLTVFISSNQIPSHVHTVFFRNNNYNYCVSITCIIPHLARGMMRMRIPSYNYTYSHAQLDHSIPFRCKLKVLTQLD